MKLNLKRPLAFFDLEATGLNIAKDRIVEIAIIKVFPDGTIIKMPNKEKGEPRLLINPEISIPLETSLIHGIYDDDIKDAPTFSQLSKKLFKFLYDADLAGFNSNKFDVPLLVEEFLRADYFFDTRERNLIDVQNIFHLMEQRTLKAGYKFYCNKDLEDAHEAMPDTLATYEIFEAQIEKYKSTQIKDANGNFITPIVNDMDKLNQVSKRHNNADLLGRFVYDKNNEIVFNFGKHKGTSVKEVLKKEIGYYGWMMNGDFPLSTKKILQEIKESL